MAIYWENGLPHIITQPPITKTAPSITQPLSAIVS
jgi:hypothetical protein